MSKQIKNPGIPVLTVIVLLIVFGAFFLFTLFNATPTETEAGTLSNEQLEERAAELLANADPARGEALLTTYSCVACHRTGAENGVAPSFVGIAERAAEERPPLSAAAYIYQSIIDPAAYLVEGYAASMPYNFGERISDEELGDIIGYLLTPDAH
ncbi:MAG TPA: cytochrome c [Oceanobacillus sp.]|nr:cytochrome c [Oceanobacillus sp.]